MFMARRQTARTTVAVAFIVALAATAQAGPPLICHPFDVGTAKLLPWDATAKSWNAPDPSYDVRNLTADTLRLLSPDAPVVLRMETLRRAAIYAARDQRSAADLLRAVMARAETDAGKARDPLAWFDAGYLVESYKQVSSAFNRNALDVGKLPGELSSVDGYGMVKKAMLLSGSNPEMEFAASLMTRGDASADHRRRAVAGAPAGSLLAKNLATH
jgi:hypothetical protein